MSRPVNTQPMHTHHATSRHPSSCAGHRFQRRLLASLIGGILVTAVVALPTPSWGQTVNARLQGTAPANAQITAFNVATGTTRHAKADAQGRYLLPGLPPGTYVVDAGPGTQRTITVSVASSVTLDFSAAAAAPATPSVASATTLQGVTVVASALPDMKTSQVGNTVSQHQIDTIPQISRNFLEFADTVPGVAFNVGANGQTTLRAGALNDSQVNVFIDGVGQKSYVMGGAIAGQFASQGNPFPELAIDQYKVITAGYKAEYSQLSSAAITAVTKSGTNEFHGQVFDRYTNDSYRASTPAENAANRKTPSQEREYGFSLGGPIIQNEMHFFVTYAGKRFDTPITVTAPGGTTQAIPLLPASVAAQYGPANLPFKEDLYFAKLDWEPGDNDRFELSARVRDEHARTNIGGVTSVSAGVDNENTDRRYMLVWDHSGNGWFNELHLTHQYTFFRPTPLQFGNGSTYTLDMGSFDSTMIVTGPASPLAAQNKGQKGFTVKDDLTLDTFTWHGEHTLKTGVVYRDLTLKAADAENINPQFTYDVDPVTGTSNIPYEAFFTKPVTGLGLSPIVVTKDRQYGVYVEDDWAVTDKLLLNLGVRWDYEEDPSYLNFVTPANVVAALNSPNPYPGATPGETYADSLGMGGSGIAYNINDYISNGHNRSGYKGQWQPRLGFSYDLDGDQMHVIHGGMGRSYDRNLYNYMQLETTKSALPQFTVYFRDPTTGQCHRAAAPCFDWDPSYLNGLANLQTLVSATNGGEVDLLNNNLKPPHTDKFSLGMRNQIGDWLTDATVVRTLYRDGFAFTLGNRYPDGSFYKNGSQPWGDPVPGFGSLILGNNGIEVRSTELLVSANKPFTTQSRWGATVAYTFTRATQNRDINEHYSFDYAFVQNYPFITSNAAPRHRIVATGSLLGPWGLVFGAKLSLATPTPWNGIACYFGSPNIVFPNGSHCEAAATRPGGSKFLIGGGAWGYRDVDFQVTKNFELGYGTTLYARFDLLNVFNFRNYTDYILDFSGGPGHIDAMYNPTGNITYAPRTIKFELGVKF